MFTVFSSFVPSWLQVVSQNPSFPADAIYGLRAKPVGHVYFTWLKNHEGKFTAGHYDMLVPGKSADIKLPIQAPFYLDVSGTGCMQDTHSVFWAFEWFYLIS